MIQEAIQELLDELSQYMPLNTFFVANNDGWFNRITHVQNKGLELVEIGDSPLEELYCGLIINVEKKPVVIPQLLKHPLTMQMELTKKYGDGSFIGVPIFHKNGTIYGTLCGLDTKPYNFSEHDLRIMESMSRCMTSFIDVQNQVEVYQQMIVQDMGERLRIKNEFREHVTATDGSDF